jgi:hypothetical protein
LTIIVDERYFASWDKGMGKNSAKAAKHFSPQLRKSIVQLRYKPRLNFYQFLMSAASKMEKYPDWQTNGLSVVLKDYGHLCSTAIDYASITYEQDSGNIELEEERTQNILDLLPPALGIKSFTRLGFRRQYLVPVEMDFESIVSVLNVKFLCQEEHLRSFLPPHVEDLVYRVDLRDEEYKYHLTLGPVHKNEISKFILFNRQNHLDPAKPEEEQLKIIGQFPSVALFIDIDFYREGVDLPVKDAYNFFSDGRDNVQVMAAKLSSYVFSTTIEED